MRNVIHRFAVFVAGLGVAGLCAGGAQAAEARFATSQTYITGYTVAGGRFAVPVMGVLYNGISLSTYQQPPQVENVPVGSNAAVRRFIAETTAQAPKAPAPVAEAKTVVAPTMPVTSPLSVPAVRTTTLCGDIARDAGGALVLRVQNGSKVTVYSLDPPGAAAALFAEQKRETVRAVVIGKVDDTDQVQRISVKSAQVLLETNAEPAVTTAPAAAPAKGD